MTPARVSLAGGLAEHDVLEAQDKSAERNEQAADKHDAQRRLPRKGR